MSVQSSVVRTVLAVGLTAVQAGAAAETSPLSAVATSVRKAVDAPRAMETIRMVYSTDRWFTFPKFEETATYLRGRLEASGARDVVVEGAVADGRTQAGFWTMPLAWDVSDASLTVTSPERMELCSWTKVPACLGMWSGPTPAEGIDAELVDLRTAGWSGVRGKLVLTDKNSASLKHELVRNGALGAVNGWSENPKLADQRQWINAWGDNGWTFTRTSTPLLSYSVTPAQAERLRASLAKGKVKVHAFAATRYYDGRYPWVTGALPGTSNEEVLILGHTSEQGANDNATGVSAAVEAVATLNRLVASGQLPRPKRGIRVLLMPELYGSLSYLTKHKERTARTVAAMTVDTPAASAELAGTEYTFHLNPHVATSWADALVLQAAAAAISPNRPWHVAEHTTGTDAYLGEPAVGIPDVWPYSGTGVITHHNSADTPDTVDPASLRDLISTIATYAYSAANAGEADVAWLASITTDRALTVLQTAAANALNSQAAGDTSAGSFGLERIGYLAERGREAVTTVLRLVPDEKREASRSRLGPFLQTIDEAKELHLRRLRSAGAKPAERRVHPGTSGVVVRRTRIGTIPLDDLSQDKWEGFPSGAWDKLATIALYWCDGHRDLAAVAHLTEMEMGCTLDFDFAGYFRFLQRHGYVDVVH